MLKQMKIQNLTVFPEANLAFSPGLNVFIGENGSGKSHPLKVAYSVIAASAEEGKKRNGSQPTKKLLQNIWAEKLVNVLRPESLGRLARKKQGRKRCELAFEFAEPKLNVRFGFASSSKTEVQIDQIPGVWETQPSVFLPARELLTIYPGFVSVYSGRYLEFDETYYDTCLLLGRPAVKGAKEKTAKQLLEPIEKALGGRVILDTNGRFYLSLPGHGKMEMPLVAEGLRQLSMVARLIATGDLLDKGYLFWEEPETNLNPKLIKLIVRTILDLCAHGMQVFVATHSLFLLREFIVLTGKKDKGIQQRYFALKQTDSGVQVEQGDSVQSLDTLVLLDEELAQSDRFMEMEN